MRAKPAPAITPPLRGTQAALPISLLRAREAVMARFRPMLAAHGISEQQWRVIRVLAEQGAMDATELADRANILAPSLTRMLRSMTGRGLVLRAKDGQDARRLTLALGPAGAELIARVAPESERIYRDIEAAFGADRMAALLALLSDLAAMQPPAAD